jgi:Ser/Thr protein kinase RdoA (MazF antagonist)
MNPVDPMVCEVLAGYPAVPPTAPAVALGNASGFSGARLWRVRGTAGNFCLRAWPRSGPSPERLQAIHRLMELAQEAGLSFVPGVLRHRQRRTWTEHAGRLWELTTWMPGQADFPTRPTRPRLEAACTALARLHAVWARGAAGVAACPAIERRHDCLQAWETLLRSGWRPAFPSGDSDPVRPWAERIWRLLPRAAARLPDQLTPWLGRPLPVQPCLCDLWHAHVLFQGDAVTGLVDYGSVKSDHVAVDLARLLGSLVGDDRALQAAGMDAYRRVRCLSAEEEALVRVLDETGTVLGGVNWLRWLYHEGRHYADRDAVARRLAVLVVRMERWE